MSRISSAVQVMALGVILACPAAAQSNEVEEFYRGKVVTLVVGYPAKGGYALYARILSNQLGKHIPGNPRVIAQYMPGAGGTRAANFLFSAAPKDGTTLGMLGREIGHFQVLEGPAAYDAAQFPVIGRMNSMNSAVAVWHTAPATTLDAARQKEIIFGTTGVSSQSFTSVMMMRNLLGFKFRAVQGYAGGAEINLAMERGEIHARVGDWDAFKAEAAHYLESGKLLPIAELGLASSPDLKVPLVIDLASSSEDRTTIRFLAAAAAIGRSVYLPPGVPPTRVEALRSAFDAMMQSSEAADEARRSRIDLGYSSGRDVETILRNVVATPAELIEKAKSAVKE